LLLYQGHPQEGIVDNSGDGQQYQTSGTRVSWGRWIAIGCVLIVLACSSLICVIGALNSGLRGLGDGQREVEAVIDQYMTDMANRESDNIAFMFVERLDRAELQTQLESMDHAYFEGYRSIEVNSFRVAQQFNTDPMTPQGTVATINGTVQYRGGFTGTFDAILENHNGEWLFFFMNVNVSADKIRDSDEE
jgi:hypothetical protein